MRKELFVDYTTELGHIMTIASKLKEAGYNASNSVIVTVSTDYSSIAGQIIRHELSHEGEIVGGYGVDVPYPDQVWDSRFTNEVNTIVLMNTDISEDKTLIFVEAGVIRGSNYNMLINIIKYEVGLKNKIVTTSLYENVSSKFKSDFVAEYYDNDTNDLTFWWEKYNKHWS